MEILIYLLLPCVGSVFLLGGMFYAAYRMSGLPRQDEVSRKSSMFQGKNLLRQNGISRHALGIITVYILVCVACSLLGNTWVNMAFLFLFPLAAWQAFGTPKIYCLYYLILSVAVWLTDVAGVVGLQIAMAEGILYLNSPELRYILIVVVTRTVEFMVILLVALAAGRKAGRHITMRQVTISVLLPLYSLFNMYCLLYLMQICFTREMVFLFGLNLLLLIGLNIYFCVLVDVMSENYRLENERNLYCAQARMQHQYYEQEEEKYEASRKMIHDIRNHIQAMEALYAQEAGGGAACRAAHEEGCGDIRKAAREEGGVSARRAAQEEGGVSARRAAREEGSVSARRAAQEEGSVSVCEGSRKDARRAERYARDIHRMLNSFQQKYYTSEKLLNIILNDKARMMQRLNVKEDMKVGDLSLDFMKDTDVTALFANLLDNAVAAAAGSMEGYVRLRVNRVRQFLSVTVENSCDTEPVKTAGMFCSHRKGHEGLGLKIIRQTVEQYGGDLQLDWRDGVFTARVMLAVEEAEGRK